MTFYGFTLGLLETANSVLPESEEPVQIPLDLAAGNGKNVSRFRNIVSGV
jgi:hypothetical protein